MNYMARHVLVFMMLAPLSMLTLPEPLSHWSAVGQAVQFFLLVMGAAGLNYYIDAIKAIRAPAPAAPGKEEDRG